REEGRFRSLAPNEPRGRCSTEAECHGTTLRFDLDNLDQSVVVDRLLAVGTGDVLRRNDLPHEADFAEFVTDIAATELRELFLALGRTGVLDKGIIHCST